MSTTAADLTSRQIGRTITLQHGRLTVTGILMGVTPETAIEREGGNPDYAEVLLGPVTVNVGDGWGIVVAVPLPPHHPVDVEER